MQRKLKVLSLDFLKPAEGWQERADEGAIERIAESLKLEGLREPLVIVASGHIVHGAHRWAAAKRAGLAEVECLIEPQSGSPEEHEAKVLAENYARRHLSPVEMNNARISLMEKRGVITEEKSPKKSSKATASQKSKTANHEEQPEAQSVSQTVTRVTVHDDSADKPNGNARYRYGAIAEVAKETGTTRDALKQAAYRARKKEAAAPAAAPTPAVVDHAGVAIPESLLPAWSLVNEQVKIADLHLRQALAAIHKILTVADEQSLAVAGGEFQRIAADIKTAGHATRKATPAYLCPCCGSKSCRWCKGLGVLTADEQDYRKRMEAAAS